MLRRSLWVVSLAAAAASCSSEEATTRSNAAAGSTTSGAGAAGSGGSAVASSSSGDATTTTGAATGGTGGGGGGGGSGGDGGSSAGGAGSGAGSGGSGGKGSITVAGCYADDFVNPPMLGPDYDQFSPIVGTHCMGTNHQDITGVERVVFLGDSVTVGTPPTLSGDYYRTQLAAALEQKFGLSGGGLLWQTVNFFSGQTNVMEDGDFASCAKWGARTDDLMEDGSQLETCIPPSDRDARTLIVMTVGGNDISALTQAAIDGAPRADLWAMTQELVQKFEDAIAWIKEPGRFPNGVFVVYGNMYEFTDGTGNVQSCDVSALAGFDQPVPAPDELAAMVVWANEQYARIAVDYQVDMIFMLEEFCGHGFEADNPQAPCYRGPNTEQWFDLTCIHPNPAGHDHITDMFMAVVNE